MPRPRKDPDEVKDHLTIRIPVWLIRSVRAVPMYNNIIEDLLKKNFKRVPPEEIKGKED